jgi:transaldolase
MSGYMQWLAEKTPGAWWIDSSDPDDVKYALTMGAGGITTNPLLCAKALYAKPDYWREVLGPLPSGSADQRVREIIRRMTVHTASWVKSIYDATGGARGYVCCQVSPKLYGEADAQVEEARSISKYAPNVSVKLPMSRAGIIALEQCIAEGISVTGTVSFTLSQALAIGEACKRGSEKALSKGINPGHCNAVIMIGRLEDYLMFAAKDMGRPELCADIPHAGVLVVKKAVKLFTERNYSTVLLPSGMRGIHQIQNLAGINGILSVSPNLADDLEKQDVPRIEKLNEPVDENLVQRLGVLADFRSAYLPDGLEATEYIAFGSFQQTITQFYESGWLRIGAFESTTSP